MTLAAIEQQLGHGVLLVAIMVALLYGGQKLCVWFDRRRQRRNRGE